VARKVEHKSENGRLCWPKQFGGPGWNAVQRTCSTKNARSPARRAVVPFGPVMVAPVIMAFGNARAAAALPARHHLGEVWWCQGYSRAGRGLRPRLAQDQGRAMRKGDHYIVNGQKTWTTLGQYADWIFCLVRTDRRPSRRPASASC
jgi:alkylation response protein AidB-like acyl-CoA dehydrogenase